MRRLQMAALFFVGLTAVAGSSRAVESRQEEGYTLHRNIPYSQSADGDLLLDAYIPDGAGPFPGILIVHGGAWQSGNKFQLSGYGRELVKRGYSCFAINYRLAPKHKHPAQIEDCRSAVRWIRTHAKEYKVDPNRIGGIGYSAGAHLVSLLGTEKNRTSETSLQAVVAGGTPIDFRVLPPDSKRLVKWLGQTRGENPKLYEEVSPYLHVSADDPPMFFYHGDADEVVEILGAQEMVKKLKKAGVPTGLYVVPKGGHISAGMHREALDACWAFFDEHLHPPKVESTAAAASTSTEKSADP